MEGLLNPCGGLAGRIGLMWGVVAGGAACWHRRGATEHGVRLWEAAS